MQGSRTNEDTEAEFRKHYLVTGNVAGSARAVNIPVSTGYELRNRALDDAEFVELRDRIRARLEPEAEQMAVCAMQICMERLNRDPEAMLDKLLLAGAGKVSFQDPGAAYASSFAKLFQAITGARKLDAERGGAVQSGATEVHIHLAADDDDNSPAA